MLRLAPFLSIVTICYAADFPTRLHREHWGTKLQVMHLVNLTQALCKDAYYKLRMVDAMQDEYMNSMSYELGFLASGIMDKFKHMISIYRYYSNHTEFKAKKHSVDQMMNGYHVMQSDYNEIRAEHELYMDVLEKHLKRKLEEDEMRAKHPKNKGGGRPPGHRRALYLPEATKMEAKTKDMPIPEKKANKTVWAKNFNVEEAEYKKRLRYKVWAEKWKGFNPETEGVNIPDKIAKVGLANASNFLVKELKGVI